MLTFKGRRRIINVFLVISLLIFAVVIVVIIIREDEDMVPYQSDLLKNIVKNINICYYNCIIYIVVRRNFLW